MSKVTSTDMGFACQASGSFLALAFGDVRVAAW